MTAVLKPYVGSRYGQAPNSVLQLFESAPPSASGGAGEIKTNYKVYHNVAVPPKERSGFLNLYLKNPKLDRKYFASRTNKSTKN